MKVIFVIVLMLSLIELHAAEIRVKKMTKDGELDRSFILKTNIPDKIVLDCQSFIQGLRIGEFEEAYTYLLDSQECENLQERMKMSLRKFQNHCIDVDQDIRADYTCN